MKVNFNNPPHAISIIFRNFAFARPTRTMKMAVSALGLATLTSKHGNER